MIYWILKHSHNILWNKRYIAMVPLIGPGWQGYNICVLIVVIKLNRSHFQLAKNLTLDLSRQLANYPELSLRDIQNRWETFIMLKNEGYLFEVFMMRFFNRTLFIYYEFYLQFGIFGTSHLFEAFLSSGWAQKLNFFY